MDFRSSGIGHNGLHLPHFPPPNHLISPAGIYYHLTPSSGCHNKNSGLGASPQLQLSNASPRTCATVQPSNVPKRDDILENGGASSFAAALRNLAKNVAMNSSSSSSSCSSSSSSSSTSSNGNSSGGMNKSNAEEVAKMSSPAQSALLDVRKGFDRQVRHSSSNSVPSKKIPTIPSPMTSISPKAKSQHHPGEIQGRGTGFQPYRAHPSICEGSMINPASSQPSLSNSSSSNKFISPSYTYPIYGTPHLPYPVGFEPPSLYRAQYETYMASMAAASSPIIPISTAFSNTPSYAPKSSTVVSPGEPSPNHQSNPQSKKELVHNTNRGKEKDALDEEEPSPPKKKCLFVRPFEDNYSSQKKPNSYQSFKEPVMNTTAYHPPIPTYIQSSSPIKQEESTTNHQIKSETNSNNPNIKMEETEVKGNQQESKHMRESHVIHSENNSSPYKSNSKVSSKSESSDSKQKTIIECESTQNESIQKIEEIKSLRSIRIVLNRKRADPFKSEKTMRSPTPPNEQMEKMEFYDSSSSPSLTLPSTPPHLNKLPESHAKSLYLNVIGLTRVPDNKKPEREDIWNIALDDRLHRNSINTTTKYLIQLRNMNPVKSPKLNMGFLPPNILSKSNKSSSRKTHFITTVHNGLSLPKLPIDLGSLVPVSKSLLNEVKKTADSSPPIIVTTQMLQSSNTISATSANSAILNVGSNTFELKSVTPAWTGIENVIEGYKKYHQERDNEILILSQHLKFLKQEEAKKRSQFDTYTSQMASSVRHKNSLKSKKSKLHENIKEMADLLMKIKNL